MSHPYGDYADKTSDETHKEYAKRVKAGSKSKALGKAKGLESRSKKAGFYVHGHKNYGDVYEK